MNEAYITIIMPVFNGEKYIKRMFDCLKNQTFDNFQLIIINDASTDKSEEIILEHLNYFKHPIKYYVLNENKGAGFARNYAISMVKSPLMCFLDCDDTIKDNFLSAFVQEFEKSKYDFCFCDYDVINDENNYLRETGQLPYKNKLKHLKKAYFCNNIRICHCCIMFNSDFFISNQLCYNENFVIAEDTELVCKSVFLAKNIVDINEILFRYHEHPSLSHRKPDHSFTNAYSAMIEASNWAPNFMWKIYFLKTRLAIIHKFIISTFVEADLPVPLYCPLYKIKLSLFFGGPLLRNKKGYKQLLNDIRNNKIQFKIE